MISTTTLVAPVSDATSRPPAPPRELTSRAAAAPGSAAPATTWSRDAGLCVNCALRATCRFPVPQGGVWHCEEYA